MIYVQTSLSTLFYSQWPSNHRRRWSQFISSLFSPCCWISESVFTLSSPQTILSSCINQVQSLFTQSGFFSSLWRGHVVLRWDRISVRPVFPAIGVSWCWNSSLSLQRSSSSPECIWSHKGRLCVSAQAFSEGPHLPGHWPMDKLSAHTVWHSHIRHFISTSVMGVWKLCMLNF